MKKQQVIGNINSTVFADLRDGYAFIESHATHVRVDDDRLASLAASLPSGLPANTYDPDHHFIGPADALAAYILILDSVNFGSGYQQPLVAEGWRLLDNSLYFTISTRLKTYAERGGSLTATDMTQMSPDRFAAIAELDLAKPYSAEYAALCAQSLSETGRLVRDSFGGRFLSLVDAAQGRAAALVDTLRALPSFNDVYTYKGRTVAFYKRAQSAAADLQDAFARLGITLFSDIADLTVLADNDVPHVLRMEGVLHYTPALEQRIAAGIPLPSGCKEEIEIRGSAAHAAELIARAKGITPITLDRILWHRATENPRYRDIPSHRTLFRFY